MNKIFFFLLNNYINYDTKTIYGLRLHAHSNKVKFRISMSSTDTILMPAVAAVRHFSSLSPSLFEI